MMKYCLLAVLVAWSVHAHAQHDPGRGAVRLLAKGDLEAAVKMAATAPQKKNSPISDAERHFVLAMAECKRGNVDAAFDHAKRAHQQGLPVERFAAGPRDVFEPLYADPEFSQWMRTRSAPLLHGPMLGRVTDNSARFWVRTRDEAEVQIVVEAAGADIMGMGRTTAANDYTAVLQVTGLRPDTRYEYYVMLDGVRIESTAAFTTFPAESEPAAFSVAFGGGAGFTPENERMWSTLASNQLDAVLLLGDNVYIDDPEHRLTDRYCYYRRHSQPDWRNLIGGTPVYTIYDDHDFGMNDCVPGPHVDRPPWKREVWQVFGRNWNNPSYGGGPEQPGCWYDFYIGDVHFIMLDGRYYRDLEGGSMLGPAQKAWALETLAASKGTFKVLASPVPWSPGVKPGSRDTWDGYPEEREEIFSFIEAKRINGVILMAADRHRTDLRKIPRAEGYDLYEVMSSRLTNVHTHGLMESAEGSEFIMGYNLQCSFGLMAFDTAAEDPQVTFTMISIDNERVGSRTLKLSELSATEARPK